MNATLFMAVALALILVRPLVTGGTKQPKWFMYLSAVVAGVLLVAPIIAGLKWVGGFFGVGG